MIYCKKCGKKLKDGTRICPRCKADQEELAEKIKEYQDEVEQKNKKRKKRNIILICVCAAVVVAIAVVLAVVFTRPDAIDLTPYLTVEFSGEDGEGTAEYSFDTDSFIDDYYGEITFVDESTYEELLELVDSDDLDIDEYAITYLFEAFVSGTLSAEEGLSNDDVVSFIWDVDEDSIEEIYDIEVTYEDQIYSVSGLTESDSSDEDADSDEDGDSDEDTDSDEDADSDEDTDEDEDEDSEEETDAEDETDSEEDADTEEETETTEEE